MVDGQVIERENGINESEEFLQYGSTLEHLIQFEKIYIYA